MDIGNIVTLAGGLGLFLFGMKIMGDGLELAAGNKLKKLLESLTSNRFLGVLVGFVVTAIIQSSSATTVMVVGFVNAGLLQLSQTVGVIMGANIGTTITGLLIALNLSKIAPLAVLIGVVMVVFVKNKKVHPFGSILAGFGMIFVGLSMMSDSMAPLREYPTIPRFHDEVPVQPFYVCTNRFGCYCNYSKLVRFCRNFTDIGISGAYWIARCNIYFVRAEYRDMRYCSSFISRHKQNCKAYSSYSFAV